MLVPHGYDWLIVRMRDDQVGWVLKLTQYFGHIYNQMNQIEEYSYPHFKKFENMFVILKLKERY